MLDFESSDSDSEKQTRTTQVRHGDNLGDLIARAASALAVDKSEAGSRHTLTPEDAALFAAALDAPPAPTPRALAAAKAYKRRVVHAD